MEHISSIQGSVTLVKSNSLLPLTDLRPSKVQRALRGARFSLASPQPLPLHSLYFYGAFPALLRKIIMNLLYSMKNIDFFDIYVYN